MLCFVPVKKLKTIAIYSGYEHSKADKNNKSRDSNGFGTYNLCWLQQINKYYINDILCFILLDILSVSEYIYTHLLFFNCIHNDNKFQRKYYILLRTA